MSSRDGSALVPSSRTVVPFTVTRPSSISCSDARREAMPACDRIFCRRSTHWSTTKVTKSRSLKYRFVLCASRLRDFVSIVTSRSPQKPASCSTSFDVHRAVGLGVRDEAAQQQPHRRVAAQIRGEVFGFDRGDHVVFEAVEEEDRHRSASATSTTDSAVGAALTPMQRQQARAEVDDVALEHVAQQRRRRLGQRARELSAPRRTPPARAPCRRRRRAPRPSRYCRTPVAQRARPAPPARRDRRATAGSPRRRSRAAAGRNRSSPVAVPSCTSGIGRGSRPVQR